MPTFVPNPHTYDAVLLLSFGGPEKKDDVLPFLQNVLQGKNIPQERLLKVAEHYYHFGGKSPINDHNRALLQALQEELETHQLALPVYWGNRNWHPRLEDTLSQMAKDGVKRALAFTTSAFSSYSGCRQYLENIQAAQSAVGRAAPHIDKLRGFYNHSGFIETMVARVHEGLYTANKENVRLVFTAHSIPFSMAQNCAYAAQFHEASRLVAEGVGISTWELAYQSRSGSPKDPWLEPDILAVIDRIATLEPGAHVMIVPIGFVSDHMEVLYDLDVEARKRCQERNLRMSRIQTAGIHPRFVTMIRELIEERLNPQPSRPTLGSLPPAPDVCALNCCPKKI